MTSSNPDSSPPYREELRSGGVAARILPLVLAMARPRGVAVFVHQPTGSVTVIEGSLDIESLLQEVPPLPGPFPATEASIDALPLVQVSEPGLVCSICLAEYEVNGAAEVKQLPCSHKFHARCVGEWLGIRGSCPVCRFSMPVEESNESYESGGTRANLFIFQGRADPDSISGVDEAGAGRDGNQDREIGRDDAGDDGNDV